MLNEVTNRCENFSTESGAHMASAHTDRVMLQTDYRKSDEDRNCYSTAQMWMSPSEAREVVRVLSLAIAENEEYRQWFASGAPRAERGDDGEPASEED
jgi:hypothetical protein